MSETPLRIVQISDIHLFSDRQQALLGVETQESFREVVELLKKDKTKPELILLTGDLSQDRSAESYLKLAEMLQDFKMPIYYIPGNHDDTKIMEQVYPYNNITHHRHIVLKHWHIILLNSQKKGAVEGHLDHAQLTFLQHCLQMYPEHYAIVVLHHQPVPVGSAWLDKLGLTNATALWEILASFPKVKTILFGHVHQEHAGEKNGIQYWAVPSTCIQFKPKDDNFALDELTPAYRWVDLYSNGKITTGVTRLGHYVGKFDKNAKGY